MKTAGDRESKIRARIRLINSYLLEDAEDAMVHGWAPPDHSGYFEELKALEKELRALQKRRR